MWMTSGHSAYFISEHICFTFLLAGVGVYCEKLQPEVSFPHKYCRFQNDVKMKTS